MHESDLIAMAEKLTSELGTLTRKSEEFGRLARTERDARLAAEDQVAELRMMADPSNDGLPFGDEIGHRNAS